jgi:hypothetical protein
MDEADLQTIVRQAIKEYMLQDKARLEPGYKTELQEERKRREQLEKRLNEMAEEGKEARVLAEEVQRAGAIRSELQRLGVVKLDLVFKTVQDQIMRTEDGQLMAGNQMMNEYLKQFVEENPEFLPARFAGGAEPTGKQKAASASSGSVNLDRIGPGMNRDELERVREEIVRVGAEMNR